MYIYDELRILFIFVHMNPESIIVGLYVLVCVQGLITLLFLGLHLARWLNQTKFNSDQAFSGFWVSFASYFEIRWPNIVTVVMDHWGNLDLVSADRPCEIVVAFVTGSVSGQNCTDAPHRIEWWVLCSLSQRNCTPQIQVCMLIAGFIDELKATILHWGSVLQTWIT